MAGGTNNCWHCGVPLQQASKYIGILDVIFGTISVVILSIHISETNRLYYHYGIESRYSYHSFHGLTVLPYELLVIMLVASATQTFMGVVLYIGAMNKSRSICQFWLITTGFTALFTGIFLRLWEMFVVNEFSRELRDEQEITYFTGSGPQGQQIPPYLQQHSPTDKYQHQGLGVMAPPPIGPNVIVGGDAGVNGYSQFYHQQQQQHPIVAAPVTNLYGVQIHGNGSQYPTQSAYNPGSSMPNPQVPAALQPPPKYDALEGVGGGYEAPSAPYTPPVGEDSRGFSISVAKY